MPPDPVLLNALRSAPPDRLKRVLRTAAEALAEAPDWVEVERIVREHLGLAEAIRLLEGDRAGDDPAPPGGPAPRRRRRHSR
jgi:hypothetical protein